MLFIGRKVMFQDTSDALHKCRIVYDIVFNIVHDNFYFVVKYIINHQEHFNYKYKPLLVSESAFIANDCYDVNNFSIKVKPIL